MIAGAFFGVALKRSDSPSEDLPKGLTCLVFCNLRAS